MADQPILPRDRTGCSARIRTLAALPPVEIAAAVTEVITDEGSNTDDVVLVATARRLGYALQSLLTNRTLSTKIRTAIADLLKRGPLTRENQGRLILARDRIVTTELEERIPKAGTLPEEPSSKAVDDTIIKFLSTSTASRQVSAS